MGKRKLRSCTNCGRRHGPPTGKSCTRSEDAFVEKNKEMDAELACGQRSPFEVAELELESQIETWENPEMTFTHKVHMHVAP